MAVTLRELGIDTCSHPIYSVHLIDRQENDDEVICIHPDEITTKCYLKCQFCGAIFEWGRWLSGSSIDYPIRDELIEFLILV
jgi:hypothetical protein